MKGINLRYGWLAVTPIGKKHKLQLSV